MCVQHILHACAATASSVLCLRPCRREHGGVAHFLCAQVFITYGDKANADLLVSYGFVPDGHNPSDAVSITVGFDPADPLSIQVSALRCFVACVHPWSDDQDAQSACYTWYNTPRVHAICCVRPGLI